MLKQVAEALDLEIERRGRSATPLAMQLTLCCCFSCCCSD
jgi:hypothetical protein